MVLWSAGILLALGLTWFVGVVVVPFLQVRWAVQRAVVSTPYYSKEIGRLGGEQVAARKLRLYLRMPMRWAPCRNTAIRMLCECGYEAAPDVWQVLRKEAPDVRVEVMRGMGWIGISNGTEYLLAELQAPDPAVRQAAALALMDINDPRTVEPLAAALKDRDAGVRCAAATALGDMGAPRSRITRIIGPLQAALKDENEGVRDMARRSLDRELERPLPPGTVLPSP
jgi:hypothetical protein